MKKALLKNKINRFYSTLATVDVSYDNYRVSVEDLKNPDILEEILYDLEENFFSFDYCRKLHRQVLKQLHRVEVTKKVLLTVASIMIFGGLLLAAGSEGSDYLGRITFTQAVLGGIAGIIIMGIGTILYKKGEN